MQTSKNRLILRTAAIVALLTGNAMLLHGATVNFDTYVSQENNDLINQFAAWGTTQIVDNGITGGSVVSQGGQGVSATYRTSQSQTSPMSIFFRYDGPQTVGLGASARLGWVGDLAAVDFFQPSLYFWGEFYNDGSFNVRNNASGQPGGGATSTLGSITAPTLGHWLKLGLSATRLTGANYELAMSLDDFGASGSEAPVNLFSGSTQVVNGLAAADDSMYPGFAGWYRAPYYDNFSVQAIPEPGSAVLLGFGLALVGSRLLRHRGSPDRAL